MEDINNISNQSQSYLKNRNMQTLAIFFVYFISGSDGYIHGAMFSDLGESKVRFILQPLRLLNHMSLGRNIHQYISVSTAQFKVSSSYFLRLVQYSFQVSSTYLLGRLNIFFRSVEQILGRLSNIFRSVQQQLFRSVKLYFRSVQQYFFRSVQHIFFLGLLSVIKGMLNRPRALSILGRKNPFSETQYSFVFPRSVSKLPIKIK